MDNTEHINTPQDQNVEEILEKIKEILFPNGEKTSD